AAGVEEAGVLGAQTGPGIASDGADGAEKRDAHGTAEILRAVRIGNSVVRVGPDDGIPGREDLAATAENAGGDARAATRRIVVVAARLGTREVDRLDSGERYHEHADVGHRLKLGAESVSRQDSGAEELRSEHLRLVVEVFVLLREPEDVPNGIGRIAEPPASQDSPLLDSRDENTAGTVQVGTDPERIERMLDLSFERIPVEGGHGIRSLVWVHAADDAPETEI